MEPSFDRSGDSLPSAPATADDFRAWKRWASSCAEQRRWPEAGRPITWRAMLANWADESVDPEVAATISHQLLLKAHEAPPYTIRAAQQLLDYSVAACATSPDILYLAAAFAWPLRDLLPDQSMTAWSHLVRASWQTDAATLVKLCIAIEGPMRRRPLDVSSILSQNASTAVCGRPHASCLRRWCLSNATASGSIRSRSKA